ncbi:hypothetical protein ACTQ54_04190 [Fundicoccus sp. Sow4_H7]|uniref:hypothetical protein n=1 Tax=Fundicoccus sp. Sow4_H7 TaxID=3438784 RepID=UPI003F93BBE0
MNKKRTYLLLIMSIIALAWFVITKQFVHPKIVVTQTEGDEQIVKGLTLTGSLDDYGKTQIISKNGDMIRQPTNYPFSYTIGNHVLNKQSILTDTNDTEEVLSLFSIYNRPSFIKDFRPIIIEDDFSFWLPTLKSTGYEFGFVNHIKKQSFSGKLDYKGDNALSFKQFSRHGDNVSLLFTKLNFTQEEDKYYMVTLSTKSAEIVNETSLTIPVNENYQLLSYHDFQFKNYQPESFVLLETQATIDYRSDAYDNRHFNVQEAYNGVEDKIILIDPETLETTNITLTSFGQNLQQAKENLFAIEDKIFTVVLDDSFHYELYEYQTESEQFIAIESFSSDIEQLIVKNKYLLLVTDLQAGDKQLTVYQPKTREIVSQVEISTNHADFEILELYVDDAILLSK